MKRIYIAGPYSAPTRQERENNAWCAEDVGHQVFRAGAYPVIPHLSGIKLEHICDDWEVWMAITSRELSTCDACVVVPGWQKSRGTNAEIEQCKRDGRPVFFWRWNRDEIGDLECEAPLREFLSKL